MWNRKSRRRSKRVSDTRLNKQEKRSHLLRINVIYGMVFLSFTGLILRLGYVQIVRGPWFRTQAQTTSLNKVPVLPARGWIYDTNGNLLAYDKPSYSVYLTRLPHVQQDYEAMAAKLAPQFHMSAKDVVALMSADKEFATVRLFKNVNPQQLAFVEENQSDFPGVSVNIDAQRYYPNGDLAGQVLGYVGPIPEKAKDYYKNVKQYLSIQNVGLTGIEQQYEDKLQGTVGQQVVEVNSSGTSSKQLGYDPPQTSGQYLQLTLDGHLQAKAQQIVVDVINKSKYAADIKNAGVVMLDVKTGGVLSMVSYPYYDPNWYTTNDYLKHANYLKTSGAQMNYDIQAPNYPGSTVKPANLLTGLEHGVVWPGETFNDHYDTRIATDIRHDDAPHGTLTPVQAITVSCDTFFYEVGLMLGKWYGSSETSGGGPGDGKPYVAWRNSDLPAGLNALFDGEWRFGLGQKTGIDIPGEVKGRFFIENAQGYQVDYDFKSSEQSISKTGIYVNYGNPVDLAFAGIGQSQEFTPMQLAQYVMTIADNGKRLQPHLLKAVYAPEMQHEITPDSKPLEVVQPVVQDTLKLNPQYLKMVQQGMYGVCNDPSGTAYGLFYDAPYKAAGKTGTAQIYLGGKMQYNSVFIAYAPYDNPQVAIAVMAPGGGYGAETSASIARQMFDTYFQEQHASFFQQNQWQDTKIPADWQNWSAYKVPEESK